VLWYASTSLRTYPEQTIVEIMNTDEIFSVLNTVAFSPQANYSDRATAACRRS
jgi:hypothetical protein